jgi:hypothetical protein
MFVALRQKYARARCRELCVLARKFKRLNLGGIILYAHVLYYLVTYVQNVACCLDHKQFVLASRDFGTDLVSHFGGISAPTVANIHPLLEPLVVFPLREP